MLLLTRETALDYFEGWFDGDAARMERALHPELAKRSLEHDASGAEGRSRRRPPQGRREEPGPRRSPHRGRGRAPVQHDRELTVHSAVYEEYLHLVHTRDGWKIVNALWQWADNRKEER